jgi:regulatory protein YycH of two-component signal transduction system YycFG
MIIKKLFKLLLWFVVIMACVFAYLVFSGKVDFKNLLNKTSDAGVQK